jgi:beta-glucosidase/6-phospho-beta-glucosidase/beta-galactosidase
MANGGLESHGAAKREAKQVGFFESEMPYQASDIVSHVLKTEGAIREGCASVSIQIDTNDLILLSKRFGLIYVDYPTQRRIIKDSGRWYASWIASTSTLNQSS